MHALSEFLKNLEPATRDLRLVANEMKNIGYHGRVITISPELGSELAKQNLIIGNNRPVAIRLLETLSLNNYGKTTNFICQLVLVVDNHGEVTLFGLKGWQNFYIDFFQPFLKTEKLLTRLTKFPTRFTPDGDSQNISYNIYFQSLSAMINLLKQHPVFDETLDMYNGNYPNVIPWDRIVVNQLYTPAESEIYQQIDRTCQEVTRRLVSNQVPKAVNIVGLGVGNARDCYSLAKVLKQKTAIVGFDINVENLRYARKRNWQSLSRGLEPRFIQADLASKIGKQALLDLRLQTNHDHLNLILAVGFFGTNMLAGPKAALEIIQILWNLPLQGSTHLLTSSKTISLLKKHICLAAGFYLVKVDQCAEGFENITFETFKCLPMAEYFQQHLLQFGFKQSKKIIDLSFTSAPMTLLNRYISWIKEQSIEVTLEEISSIELSWCYLREADFPELVKALLSNFTNLNTIIVSSNEDWSLPFKQYLNRNAPGLAIKTREIANSMHLPRLPVAEARAVGWVETREKQATVNFTFVGKFFNDKPGSVVQIVPQKPAHIIEPNF